MNGVNYLLDTNIILGMYQHSAAVIALMQSKQVGISQCAYSTVTRMELLGFVGITEHEERTVKALLDRMTYLSLSPAIEELTIQFRRQHRTKLPDSIIAATAQAHSLELLTLDKALQAKL
ncbi:type II toxin-antitoxin system VapC family toxin [Methylovulum psychrotolerans]|uniref:DNA-binding protein n=1 Tax=Methylovulum psychrotolerans TaxID=1704499 RepID=A0A1Z4BTL2_9GAMM|nr:type II toxin-antitoxin system VapC family toxin [Methylovulum psychrotolerans]ASF44656.1 DNA-binding protein [Methylovulum psychrotolerans]POZ52650.1 PIN domain-containing protein [Methylovulum psychrotolerans]